MLGARFSVGQDLYLAFRFICDTASKTGIGRGVLILFIFFYLFFFIAFDSLCVVGRAFYSLISDCMNQT